MKLDCIIPPKDDSRVKLIRVGCSTKQTSVLGGKNNSCWLETLMVQTQSAISETKSFRLKKPKHFLDIRGSKANSSPSNHPSKTFLLLLLFLGLLVRKQLPEVWNLQENRGTDLWKVQTKCYCIWNYIQLLLKKQNNLPEVYCLSFP